MRNVSKITSWNAYISNEMIWLTYKNIFSYILHSELIRIYSNYLEWTRIIYSLFRIMNKSNRGYYSEHLCMIYVVAYCFSSLIHLHRPYLGFPVLFYQYTLFIDYVNDVAVGILLENYAFIRHRSASVQKLDILHSNGRYFG